MENSVVIVETMRDIHANNDFFEKVLGKQQRCEFRSVFFIRVHPESRLDVDFFICIIDNKIDFFEGV